jgi:hypothetical protein
LRDRRDTYHIHSNIAHGQPKIKAAWWRWPGVYNNEIT